MLLYMLNLLKRNMKNIRRYNYGLMEHGKNFYTKLDRIQGIYFYTLHIEKEGILALF